MTPSQRAVARGALALSAGVLLTRLWFIVHRAFDVDELEHAHAAWSVARGSLPYRDFFEHHGPALYALFGPFYALMRPDASIASATRTLFVSRGFMWLQTIAAAALTFRLAQRWDRSMGTLRGALAVSLLTTSWQFLNTALEFRPDVPALVCLLAAFVWVFDADERPPRDRTVWFSAAGVAFGVSLLFTQKTVFAAPGLLIAAGGRREAPVFWAFLGGALVPIAAIGAWFAWHRAAMALFENAVAVNVRLTGDRSSPLPGFLSGLVWDLPLYVCGILGTIMTARRRASGPRAALLWSLASLAAGIAVIARVYDQYYLLMLPLLAVLGSDFVVKQLAARRLPFFETVGALACVAVVSLIGASVSAYESNQMQIEDMRLVMERTGLDDTVFSGVPGAGTFRPHAWYYFFLSGPFALEHDYAALRDALEARRVNPRMVIFDARVSAMPSNVVEYLRSHYRRVRGDIYERAD